MPKVRNLTTEYRGVKIAAELWVNRAGEFSVKRTEPYAATRQVAGHPTADSARDAWLQNVRDAADTSTVEAKVLLVKFQSNLLGRESRRRGPFANLDTNLTLEAAIAEERTTTVGGKITRTYRDHPDVNGMHKENPIPCKFRLDDYAGWREIWDPGATIVVPWSEAAQAAIVNACGNMLAIAEMLDRALATPEAFQTAIATLGLLALPSTRPGPGERISD